MFDDMGSDDDKMKRRKKLQEIKRRQSNNTKSFHDSERINVSSKDREKKKRS